LNANLLSLKFYKTHFMHCNNEKFSY